ncbi:MAG TPA: type II toxin-antitoxin system antitoxin SocA domain-containing protein [Thermoanaerobaculia bacterium]|nr:type II toxin-antitoxin system antitoxin SocA domain-containing protein [Thermoanaerobaculia bacterium]
MATAHDVASYILQELGEITAMKLQKLLYYSQAWSLVWDEAPLFRERIEAWANGPVVPALYQRHRGQFKVRSWSQGNPQALTGEQRETVDAVLKYYGDKPSQWLSDLTHAEAPWRDARRGLGPGERGNHVITHAAMAEYYSSL